MILARLKIDTKKIFARSCTIRNVKWTEAKSFLEENHLASAGVPGKCIGLDYHGKLISIIVVGSERYKKSGNLEIYRACTKVNHLVVGGLSKMLKQVPGTIMTFADRRFSTGNSYLKTGFTLEHITKPGYFYQQVNTNEIVSRIGAQKHRQQSFLNKFNPSLTETENIPYHYTNLTF